ncbi:MAG: hypothetical protein ACRDYA_10450 [Egibacteraceae bacterium]
MTALTRGTGAALVVVGVGAWLLAGGYGASPTALLPALLGLAILVLGLLAGREPLHRHAIHAALVLALLGLVGAIPRALPALTRPGQDARLAAWASLVTAVLCFVYLALGVRSFIAARRARKSTAA